MKKTAIYLLFFLLFISCKDDFIIDINSKKTSEKEFKITLTTNFPENTIFSITAERIYKRKNNGNYYGGVHYYSSEYGIKNGKLEFILKVNDSMWINNYNQYREDGNLNEFKNKKLTEIDYKSIKDSIEISVVYSPRFLFNQKSNVKKSLGENGENIKGKGTIKMDGIKVFEKSIKIFSKFEK
jgi:hypothetical protein